MSCTDPWVLEQQLRRRLEEAEAYAEGKQQYPAGAIDHDAKQIDDLQREVLQMKVHMQAQQLDELTEKVERDRNPAVKDAWDQYQTVLRLARK